MRTELSNSPERLDATQKGLACLMRDKPKSKAEAAAQINPALSDKSLVAADFHLKFLRICGIPAALRTIEPAAPNAETG